VNALREVWRTRAGKGGLVLFGVVVLAALVLPFLLPDYRVQIFPRYEAPSLAHLFGTDELGRDILARVAQGARISLMVATAAVLVAATIARAWDWSPDTPVAGWTRR